MDGDAVAAISPSGWSGRPTTSSAGSTDSFNNLLTKLHDNDQALRRTMTELVDARDAAESANRLKKSQFLANMSYEIQKCL